MSAQTTLQGHNENYSDMEANTLPTLKKMQEKVRRVCEVQPGAKGNYNLLVIYTYNMFYKDKIEIRAKNFEDLLTLPSPETITRALRKLQEKGELLPSERVQRKRGRREEIIRANITGV